MHGPNRKPDQIKEEHRKISDIGTGIDHHVSLPENGNVETLFERAALQDFKRREIYSRRSPK